MVEYYRINFKTFRTATINQVDLPTDFISINASKIFFHFANICTNAFLQTDIINIRRYNALNQEWILLNVTDLKEGIN